MMCLPVFPQLHIQDVSLKVELAEWAMLDVVPKDQPVAGVLGVVSGSDEANDIGSEKHLTKLNAAIEN